MYLTAFLLVWERMHTACDCHLMPKYVCLHFLLRVCCQFVVDTSQQNNAVDVRHRVRRHVGLAHHFPGQFVDATFALYSQTSLEQTARHQRARQHSLTVTLFSSEPQLPGPDGFVPPFVQLRVAQACKHNECGFNQIKFREPLTVFPGVLDCRTHTHAIP